MSGRYRCSTSSRSACRDRAIPASSTGQPSLPPCSRGARRVFGRLRALGASSRGVRRRSHAGQRRGGRHRTTRDNAAGPGDYEAGVGGSPLGARGAHPSRAGGARQPRFWRTLRVASAPVRVNRPGGTGRREAIVGSFDVLIARTGHRTNDIMKVLTLTSVILLPGMVIAGLMGMNFKVGRFTAAWGFYAVVAVTAAIALVVSARRSGESGSDRPCVRGGPLPVAHLGTLLRSTAHVGTAAHGAKLLSEDGTGSPDQESDLKAVLGRQGIYRRSEDAYDHTVSVPRSRFAGRAPPCSESSRRWRLQGH